MKSGKVLILTDADDRTYVDYINSWGPAIVGHAHDEVVEAVKLQAAKKGFLWCANRIETEIAKFIIENVPNIDQIEWFLLVMEALASATD